MEPLTHLLPASVPTLTQCVPASFSTLTVKQSTENHTLSPSTPPLEIRHFIKSQFLKLGKNSPNRTLHNNSTKARRRRSIAQSSETTFHPHSRTPSKTNTAKQCPPHLRQKQKNGKKKKLQQSRGTPATYSSNNRQTTLQTFYRTSLPQNFPPNTNKTAFTLRQKI
ncbi:hypothetical protein KC19_VG129900 [Ceratodon purpureus]|uniref:Uncharacterized protein n=1 Tax=Ceratodon purpureus TaxID=3225 RepID=A0A8T0HPI5_CERPU|nr:hypothetical protein KC19_VG129900 [Ceratodon purpureus]